MKKKFLILFLVSSIFTSCAMNQLKKNLDPDSKEFLSVVRYLITPEERKIFLLLPPEDRDNFKEEFWEKRDPDPDTEENEFRIEYFNLIKEANLLFKQGSTPGWLQDRGRIYITLGPPTNRRTYPRGTSHQGVPTEIWDYNFFPVIFVDKNWTGNYRLEALSAQHINEINKAQIRNRPKVLSQKEKFDFDIQMKARQAGKAVFQIEIPYNKIWFIENKSLAQTTFEVFLKASDKEGKVVWEFSEDYDVSIPNEKLEDYIGENYTIEITATIEPGNYILTVEIENKTGEERVRKRIKLRI